MKNAGPKSKEISDGDPAGIRRVIPLPYSSALPLHPPAQIPDHELLRCIGRGSYGEVWLARTVLGQHRAVKIVYREAFEHHRPFEREYEGIQKFEPISRSHPSQLAILHVGRNDEAGYFYYVMELADDASIQAVAADVSPQVTYLSTLNSSDHRAPAPATRVLMNAATYIPKTLKYVLHERGRLPFEECLQISIALTTALEHLHEHGLVHRDIKPSNIVFVKGVPKLADIGLVTSLDATLSFVGTAGYFPPEGPGTPAADLYSLGKVLYEASMGRDRQEFPKLPADLSESSERERLLELNAVILKACHSDAHERYQSTEAMHAELALLQSGKSVKKHFTWQKRLRAARKIGLAAAAVILVTACLLFLWQTGERRNVVLAPVNDDGTAGTKNAKADEAYELGLSALRRGTSDGWRHALKQFTLATEEDPRFVPAHARLFEIYLMSEDHGVALIDGKTEKLKELSARLVKMDPGGAETRAAVAITLFLNDWKWAEAESEFKQALQRDPNCRMALTYYGYFLTRLQRDHEASAVLERARKLEPTSPLITKLLGHCAFLRHDYEKALISYLRASEELDRLYPSGNYWAGRAYLAMTNYSSALTEFKQYDLKNYTRVIDPSNQKLREALEKDGPRGYWSNRIEIAKADSIGLGFSPSYFYAECYARLNDKVQALDWLEKACAQRDSMENLLVDEFWDDFRQEPRFKDVLKKVGLDRYAR